MQLFCRLKMLPLFPHMRIAHYIDSTPIPGVPIYTLVPMVIVYKSKLVTSHLNIEENIYGRSNTRLAFCLSPYLLKPHRMKLHRAYTAK